MNHIIKEEVVEVVEVVKDAEDVEDVERSKINFTSVNTVFFILKNSIIFF